MSELTDLQQVIKCPVCGNDDWDIALDEDLLDGAILGTFTCNQCQNKLED